MIGELQCVVIDCPDALRLAEFYREVLGGAVNHPDPRWTVNRDFATLHTPAGVVLAFQRAADYAPPSWPEGGRPQQFHLDIDVADLDRAQANILDLGATLLHTDSRGWRIYADPAGHPFCLVPQRPRSRPVSQLAT